MARHVAVGRDRVLGLGQDVPLGVGQQRAKRVVAMRPRQRGQIDRPPQQGQVDPGDRGFSVHGSPPVWRYLDVSVFLFSGLGAANPRALDLLYQTAVESP